MAEQYQYSDFDMNFTKNEFVKDISIKRDWNSIRQSIANIIMTTPGEKPFNPDFGVGIYSLLFEPLDALEQAKLERDIRWAIRRHEPRAEVTSIDFGIDNMNANELSFIVNFIILSGRGSNSINDSLKISLTKVR
tara:strand:- start:255 stop:659 length:405 start_codon:yes stop_codon:yes gene_type:complete